MKEVIKVELSGIEQLQAEFHSDAARKFLGTTPDTRMGIRTGFSQLDSMLRGLHNGKFYVFAGRPGDGKTSFGTSIMANIMLAAKHPVLFVSTELTETEVILQTAEVVAGGIPVFPNGRSSNELELKALNMALDKLSYQEKYGMLNIVHQKRLNIDDIAGWVKLARDESDSEQFLVIIDQASRIKRNDEHGRKPYAIATEEMLNQMEEFAHRYNVALVLFTQLNRQTELQSRPMLSNLKHSGAFEEYAHAVVLLERDPANGQSKEGSSFVNYDAVIHVAKNRSGKIGPIPALFFGEYHTWRERL